MRRRPSFGRGGRSLPERFRGTLRWHGARDAITQARRLRRTDGRGQDLALARARGARWRRGRQRRFAAGLRRHGHRHREGLARRSRARAAPSARRHEAGPGDDRRAVHRAGGCGDRGRVGARQARDRVRRYRTVRARVAARAVRRATGLARAARRAGEDRARRALRRAARGRGRDAGTGARDRGDQKEFASLRAASTELVPARPFDLVARGARCRCPGRARAVPSRALVSTTEPPPLSDRMILEFERPIIDLEQKISELRGLSTESVDFTAEIRKLEQKARKLQKEVFADLTAQQKVQLARHPGRPYMMDYVGLLMDDFIELHGDRSFSDDPAIIGGLATFDEWEVLVLGHQKGRNTKDNMHRNFGMARPEGYRKATRLMRLASRYRRPIICFIDTPGAYPGLGAEERGQAEAIAKALQMMASLECPMISVVIGEGGSGGALALGVTDRILMLEYSVYSVISPEGCASILWRDPAKIAEAATQLKLTAPDLLELGICDEIVVEPSGGAHRNAAQTAAKLRTALKKQLKELVDLPPGALIARRYQKIRKMGAFIETPQ